MIRDVAQSGGHDVRRHGVGCGGGANVRLEPITIDNIDRAVKEAGNVVFQSGIVEDGHVGRRIEFNHYVDIAIRPIVAARTRTEQRRVSDTPRP